MYKSHVCMLEKFGTFYLKKKHLFSIYKVGHVHMYVCILCVH